MPQPLIHDVESTDQERAEFEKDYARWCFEVELEQYRIQILNYKEQRDV
jgi:hypothetical protein